ncbi:hypothetical protein BKA64DRAFT_136619 [Cadophora sp. MPI-SDFR-AT-0126]|nr:hypothetical protein BKA64DRAFT_136619 [Leotiomycetes sp. MPI-SDFR-AT-0126]
MSPTRQEIFSPGILNIFGAKARARSAYTEEARALTALSRKRGVCERCRKFKARCDMPDSIYEPCRRCSLVVTGVLRQPCIRVNLVDISLHRIGSTKDSALDGWMRSQQTLQIVNGVVGTGHRTLLLTQDFGFELEVTVARYNAGVGDKVSYPWRDASGVAREYKMPPYYMINFEDTKQAMVEYNRRSFVSYIQRNLRDKNPIVWMTFQAAIRHSTKSQSPLVRNALLFWSGARLIERPWRLCGTDTLGLSPNEDIDSPWYGTVPVTPIMDTQLDHLVIDCLLIPLRQRILAQLFDKILKKKKEDWFEIYLAMFVVMYNMERNFAYVLFFTSYYGVMGKFGSRGTSSLSESFIHACKTMLAYFHYVYNGAAILSSPLEKSSLTMPEEQYAYIQALQKERTRQGDDLTLLKDKSMYETDMYWCHQLLFKDCQVEKQNEKEIDELQEEDYLMHSEDD